LGIVDGLSPFDSGILKGTMSISHRIAVAAGEGKRTERPAPSPRVSVLMPMRNAGAFLAAAVASILDQSWTDLELVVVDDGSTDGSREYISALEDERICLVDGPRRGISACMNRALQVASGAIIMRCDADDLYPPGRIALQVEWLAAHPDYVALCGRFCMIGNDGAHVGSPISAFTEELLDAAPRILDRRLWTHLCAFAFRRDAAAALGGFREYFETSEDADFLLRLAEVGPVGFLPVDAYLYRIHDSSITHTQTSIRRRFFEAVAHEMSRDRLATGTDALMRGQPPALPSETEGAGRPTDARIHIAQLLIGEAWQVFARGDRAAAIRNALRAVKIRPQHLDAWKTLVLVCLRKPQPGRGVR
jgi:GT2 family glycosyltransferase